MDGSWSGPSVSAPGMTTSKPKVGRKNDNKPNKFVEAKVNEDEQKYHALIVDSGAIIKHTGFSRLHNTAERYFTTQGVIDEIRDSKARSHMESLPFELEVRDPTAEGLAKMVEFSKKTGDYASLSAVDMHILALLYDLEKEGCNTVEHIRTEPKRALTGRITALNKNPVKVDEVSIATNDTEEKSASNTTPSDTNALEGGADFFQGKIQIPAEMVHNEQIVKEKREEAQSPAPTNATPVKKSWATLVNHTATSTTLDIERDAPIAAMAMTTAFGSMNLASTSDSAMDDKSSGGQFSDAEDDESLDLPIDDDYDTSDDDGDEYASIGDDFSDEDCDIYILDPEEVEENKAKEEAGPSINAREVEAAQNTQIEQELEMQFPSLSAALTVPYEGSDDEGDKDTHGNADKLKKAEEEDRKKREASLKPISSSGKLYNSFRGYKDIVSSGGVKIQANKKGKAPEETKKVESFDFAAPIKPKDTQSRVIGGTGFSGQSAQVDDDGEGWITSTKEIASMKAMGTLDPYGSGSNRRQMMKIDENLPPKSDRAACATTDFAMQNVILQMNLELLSVDGVKVRKLKSWVMRCACCFKVYTGSDNDGKRIFCDKCGSSSLHRIAASVDGKTGRLKLHLKKNYKSKTRGTQFALPKPGTQNKYMGDLLLAEDQLMYGAWNQRVKMTRSKKEKQSIFGTDIAATVGCHQDLTKRGDIKVGFGRKNPNATKSGRERRGKKKKTTDKACGLRRY